MTGSTLRRTPCVGICSTTYGDLVCRGCKRFAHEIVQWNGFEASQQEVVWQRLYELRAGAMDCFVRVVEPTLLLARAHAYKVPDLEDLPQSVVAYEVLRRGAAADSGLRALGLVARDGDLAPRLILAQVEQEIFQRSVAQYERSFHIVVD